MRKIIFLTLGVLLSYALSGCYTFTGTSIPLTVKTYSVQFFENRAPLVDPTLSQKFTEGLKDRISRQSPLGMTRSIGDVNFEGTIVGYRVEPVSFTSEGTTGAAEQNRLTITVQVKCTNTKDEKQSFEQSFSQFENFPKGQNLASVQQQLNQTIIDKLTTDIYNRAFSNW